MSNLTVGLAILGGLLLVAVIAHSTWNSRRNALRMPQPENADNQIPTPASQALVQVEPTLDGVSLPDQPMQPLFDGPDDDPVTHSTVPMVEKKPGIDALIDVITPVNLEAPLSGDMLLATMPPTRRAGSKPLFVEGLNAATRQWEAPAPGRRYNALQVGLQLTNRTGAINEIEFSEFVVKIQSFCDAINGMPEFPDMLEAVASARELDQFAGAHDAQLSFRLRARHAAWSPGYVQQNAARLGFVAGAIPGRMVLAGGSAGSAPLLGLSFDTQAALSDDPAQSAIREVTLSLDVPHVERQEKPFERMRDAAVALATAMDGVMIDDNGQLIHPDALDGIADDLEVLYDALDARDLSAGSPLARRLFS